LRGGMRDGSGFPSLRGAGVGGVEGVFGPVGGMAFFPLGPRHSRLPVQDVTECFAGIQQRRAAPPEFAFVPYELSQSRLGNDSVDY